MNARKSSGGGKGFQFVGVRQVAAAAGVSTGTVSNVLNRPETVSEQTRLRVQGAIDALGFVPSIAAGQLRGHRSKQIGVVVPDVGNPYWASVLRGVESIIEAEGLSMLVSSTHQDRKRQRSILRAHRSQGVDGLIHVPISESAMEWQEFERCTYGIVTIKPAEQGTDRAAVGSDDVTGARLAMEHLLELGHRSICFINGPHFVPWCANRLEGVRRAIEARGLRPSKVLKEISVADLTVAGGKIAAKRILAEGEATAVLCANDVTALGVILACDEARVTIPQDLSVVGYDDVDFAPALRPSLTTVHQPSFEIGVAAACRLLGRAYEVDATMLAPKLVARDSTGVPTSIRD